MGGSTGEKTRVSERTNPETPGVGVPLGADDEYTIASARSGLLLTAASATDGAQVIQQTDTGSALQRWTIG
ncbi:RICIN domain-containing protein [Streptomyces sp. NPDC006527]|uniref:RICIN domain-containing protein n=1 Tax=Streptomyces sp. NPDC006527 TaxID=3364749 RepID=UPI0036747F67